MKPEVKLEPLIVKVVATLEVTLVGEMEEMVGAGAGGGVGGVVEGGVGEPPTMEIGCVEITRSSYQTVPGG